MDRRISLVAMGVSRWTRPRTLARGYEGRASLPRLLLLGRIEQLGSMEIVFLGTGTSQGVPMIAHDSGGLDLTDIRNWRTRTSAHVVMAGQHIQIDAAPEFRLQCIQNRIDWIDSFILTHGHADHVLGMDDLRRFIDLRGGDALPVYTTEEGMERVQHIYPYAIRERPVYKGYPAFQLNLMPPALELAGGRIRSFRLPHGRIEVLGLVFEEFATGAKLAYFTDCKSIPEAALAAARGADLVVLDALRPSSHPTHMNTEEALAAAEQIGGKVTRFVHMTFMIDHGPDTQKLPEGIDYAHDGLRIRFGD